MPLIGGTPRAFLSGYTVNVGWSSDGALLAYHTGEPVPDVHRRPDGGQCQAHFCEPGPGRSQSFSGLVSGWSLDLLHLRELCDTGHGSVADCASWRRAGAADPASQQRHLPDAHRLADGAVPVAGRRWLRAVAVGPRRGAEDRPAVPLTAWKNTSRSPRTATGVVWSPVFRIRRPVSRACRFSIGRPRSATSSHSRCRQSGRRPRASGPGACSTCRLWAAVTGSGGTRTISRSNSGKGPRDPVGTGGHFTGRQTCGDFAATPGGRIQLNVMSADGTGLMRFADTLDLRGSASWSPDGNWVVTGGIDAKGPGVFKVPVGGGDPVRLAARAGFDPVWSPDGNLIVYTGDVVAASAPLLAIRPDGSPIELPAIEVRTGGHGINFCPTVRAWSICRRRTVPGFLAPRPEDQREPAAYPAGNQREHADVRHQPRRQADRV